MKKIIPTLILAILITLLTTAPISATATTTEATTTSTGGKLIAITFDDGPSQYTATLLDALKARNVKATFFLVGSRVSTYAGIVKREYDEGHQVASHTWDHAKLTSLGYASFMAELTKTDNAITAAVGQEVNLVLRPPYGSCNSNVKSWAGCPLILWSVDPNDWKYKNATTVKNNIVKGAKDGAIILVHDLYSTSVQGAIAAIDELQKQGYTFVTVNELFRRKGMTLQAGVVYTNAPNNGVDLGPLDPYAYDESKLSEHWAYQYITYAKENGLMAGLSADTFGPNYPMTRAMFITVISRLSGETISGYDNAYSDVKYGTWYTDAVAWATAKGIVAGTGNGLFEPDRYVTREEACVMMVNFMKYLKLDTTTTTPASFSDSTDISTWATEAVNIMANKGIVRGEGNNIFAPKANATRAEAAVILTKFHQLIKNTPSTIITTLELEK